MNNRKNNCRSAAALQSASRRCRARCDWRVLYGTPEHCSVGMPSVCGFISPLPVPATSDHNPGSLAPNGEPSCTPQEVSDKLENNDPKQQGALVPSGVPSSCGAPNACNVTAGNGRFHYKAFGFYNPDTDKCVTATLSTSRSGANAIFGAAYLPSFDSHNICANLIGDSGVPADGSAVSFSFNVPAGTIFWVVVSETTQDALCSGFKLSVDLCGGSPPPTPTPGVEGCGGAFTGTPSETRRS